VAGEGASAFELNVLGRFELRRNGQILIDRQWPRRKAAAIVKLLALEPSHALHRDRLMEALWPEQPVDSAANSLYKSLHYLKGEADGIAALRANVVALGPGVRVDLDGFMSSARAAINAGDGGLCEDALALCGGELLPDDVYEEWTERRREEVELLRLRLLNMASVHAVAAGRLDLARERLGQILAIDPANEDAHRGLMRVLLQAGDTEQAVQQYERCREALRAELDVEPSPRTERLFRSIIEARRAEPPLMRFANTGDGARIAYYVIGEGAPIVIMPPLFLSHIRREWDVPAIRARNERFARGRSIVLYDPRNTGLSDRHVDVAPESPTADLDAVVEELRLPPFVLFAEAGAGPSAIMYAHQHPERVSHLVLYATCARGADALATSESQSSLAMMPHDWRRFCEVVAAIYTGWDQPATAGAWAQVLAEASRPEFVEAAIAAIAHVDVTPLLAEVRTPALVIRRRDAPIFNDEMSRQLATMPNSRYVLLDGRATASFCGDVDALVDCIDAFIASAAPRV